jgi:hypothetical protein
MKSVCIFVLATLLSGCAMKKPLTTNFTTTPACINPVQTQNALCTQVTAELYECNHLLVKISCVRVKNPDAKRVARADGGQKSTP